jgi:hypothetical protein
MPLFGRTEPLATAAQVLDAAAAGRGGALVVMGEPGIGKSALARTLAAEAEARGARVGFGRAWEVGGAPAYWPWAQALTELGLDLDELLGTQLQVVGAQPPMAGAQRVVAFDRVVRAVCENEGSLVVLILDDLHAADVASAELALAFARAAVRKRALLVVTTREAELLERREIGDLVGRLMREGVAVPLHRLGLDDTERWLSSLGFKGDPAEVHRISEGNPLFIEEAVRLGVDRFATGAASGVSVILSEHLARISATTRETLAIGSVLGREATHADVAALDGGTLDGIEAAVREGQQAGVLLRPKNGSLVFSHLLLRDALYGTLAASRRESLHMRAAERIDAQAGPAALVAQHLLAAGEVANADRVARAVLRAAETAIARHAADSAAQIIATARAKLAGRLSEATTLTLDLGEVDATMRSAPSDEGRARAADCAARAERLGLATEHVRAALIYGRELVTGRVDTTMVRLLGNALAKVPAEERSLRAQVLSRLAASLIPPTSDDEKARAIAYAHEAIAIARELEDVPTLLHTLRWSAATFVFSIPLEEFVAISNELVSLAREHGAELAYEAIGAFYTVGLRETGRLVAARHEAEAYYRLMDSLPLPALRWKATTLRCTMAALDGRLDEARMYADELRQAGTTSGHAASAWAQFEVAFCSYTRDKDRFRDVERDVCAILAKRTLSWPLLACADALQGRSDAARARFQTGIDLSFLAASIPAAQTAVLLESTELADLLYGPLARAAPCGRFYWGASGGFPIGPVSRLLGELSLLRGDNDRAREHFDAAIDECREMEALPFLALSEEARARVSDPSSRPPAPPRAEPKTAPNVALTREGDVWIVTSGTSGPFRVKHAKGMHYLDHLLRSPGREIYALVLGGAGEAPEDAGAVLDEHAKRAYKLRVEELEDQLDEAERLGDRGRATRAREELEILAEQLASAVGLGGRDRKAASNVERARVNVQRRLKDAIRRIAEHDSALGRYLDATIRTGTYCVYRPV